MPRSTTDVVACGDATPVSGRLANAARAWLEAGGPPGSSARPASTVMVLRDAADGLEVFVMRRVSTMAFAPSTWVFPGGGVDPRDRGADLPWSGPSACQWGEALGASPAQAEAVVVAAAREVYEECGVLLAGAGSAVVDDVPAVAGPSDRANLLDRTWSFSEMLRARGLTLRSDLLRPVDHWITPHFEPRRYDTWFFVALLPDGQQADDATTEADQCEWMRPVDLLARADAGQAALMPPTRVQLEWLSGYADAATAYGANRPMRAVLPRPRLIGIDVVLDLEDPTAPGGSA